MNGERQEQCGKLETLDTSLGFLLLILASVILSYLALSRRREALCLSLEGQEARAQTDGAIYPLRLGASALAVGALGYFLSVALEAERTVDPRDRAAVRSAARSVWSGLLVFAAALIRLFDLNAGREAHPWLIPNPSCWPDSSSVKRAARVTTA